MQNSENITTEILGLEKKYWNAMRDHDLQTALSLTDFPCIVAGERGAMAVEREAFEKMFKSNQDSVRSFDFDESGAEVRQLGPETVVVAYKVHSTISKDGKNESVDAVDTSTWIRRDNKWVCAMHTETHLLSQ